MCVDIYVHGNNGCFQRSIIVPDAKLFIHVKTKIIE